MTSLTQIPAIPDPAPAAPLPLRRAVGYAGAALGIQAVWATLAAFLPPALQRLEATPWQISLVLAADPVTALVVLPLTSAWSDRLSTRWGRRLPLVAGLSAVAVLALLLLARAGTLAVAAAAAWTLCAAVNGYLGPYRAMLVDEFDAPHHSAVSGIQTLARESGTLLVFALGALALVSGPSSPFLLTAALVAGASAWTAAGLRPRGGGDRRAALPVGDLARRLVSVPRLRRVCAVQFGWWFAVEAVRVFVVLFVVRDVLGVADLEGPGGAAALASAVGVLVVISASGMLAAVPIGVLAARRGARPVLCAGVAVFALGFVAAARADSLPDARAAAVLAGVGFAAVQVLSFPWLVEEIPDAHAGGLAAAYNVLMAVPQLVALLVMGWLITWTGSYRTAFTLGAVVLAGVLSLLVLLGRPGPGRSAARR